jgi:glucose-1-phosphate adenylyltransferase
LEVLGIILAGGRGQRLHPLTRDRAKPAVPFGGKYRLIDFVLSNFVNSGICSIYVFTQFKAQSLMEHIEQGWQIAGSQDEFIVCVPPQMHKGSSWYLGTADAVYQNTHLITQANPSFVAVFSADHIFKMNVRQMLAHHREQDAEVTVAAIRASVDKSPPFGVIEMDTGSWVLGFYDKRANPQPIAGSAHHSLISMGNYLFNTDILLSALEEDATDAESSHNFNRDILPRLVKNGRKVSVYDFRNNRIPTGVENEEMGYWRDIGNIDDYFQANMDLCSVSPSLNLYNRSWPIWTAGYHDPPAKFVFDEDRRRGMALNSLIGAGTIISGTLVRDSVIGTRVRIHSHSFIEHTVVMSNVEIGRGCRIRRAVVDKNVYIRPGTEIGYQPHEDRKHYFVTDTGIVVIPETMPSRPWAKL